MYDPYRKEVSVLNYSQEDFGELTAEMTLYDIKGNIISETLSETVNVVPDKIGARTGETIDRVVGFVPTKRNGNDWYEADVIPVTYSYGIGRSGSGVQDANGAKRAQGDGVQLVWNKKAIEGSLIRPTSDVYFMRLELKDGKGNVVSYNTYAIPRRQDASSKSGNQGIAGVYISQTLDWTQLKSLPEVKLDVALDPVVARDGNYIIQAISLTNNTNSIAHGIELKAYKDGAMSEMCPVTYDDNLITLFPGQTRTLTISHNKAYLDGPVHVKVTCFNNTIADRPARVGNIYHPFDPVGQTTAGTTTTTPDATTNLARNRQYAIGTGSFGTGDLTGGITAYAVNEGNRLTTVVDSNFDTPVNVTPAQGYFTIDLGSSVKFDRTMLRWNGRYGTNMMGGAPDYVKVEVADSTAGPWVQVANYNNTKARAILTNIVLAAPVTARYIRVTPSGLTNGSTAYGSGPGSVSSQTTSARANPTAFVVGGVEVYLSFNYVNLVFDGGDYTVSHGGLKLTADSSEMDKMLKAYYGSALELAFAPNRAGHTLILLLNGEDISKQLEVVDGVYYLALEGIEDYSTLSVQWSRNPITSLKISNAQGVAMAAAITAARNSTMQFDYVINADALHEGIVWSVSNTAYATVNAETGVLAIKNLTGTVMLTATDPLNGATHSIVLRIV